MDCSCFSMLNFEIDSGFKFELAAHVSSIVATISGCHIKDKPSPEEISSTVPCSLETAPYSLDSAPYDSTPYSLGSVPCPSDSSTSQKEPSAVTQRTATQVTTLYDS